MDEQLGKRGAEKEVELPARKKGKKGGSSARGKDSHESVEAFKDDLVRVVPYRKPTAEDDVGAVVLLSKQDKAPQLQLSEDRLSVTGQKGFRSVRATHGAHEGTFYCEATVQHLGSTGHCRLGWSSKRAEINAPVGYDAFGVGYRDLEGSSIHKALRSSYGAAYSEGGVIGLLLHMPPGGRPMEARAAQVVRYKGLLYQVQEDEPEPKPLPGSFVGFFRNGQWQGKAAEDLLEGTYYPTVSLFTLPEQAEGATVTMNFGPNFKFPPEFTVLGLPAAEPVSALPAQAAAAEAATAAELMGEDPAAAAAAAAEAPAEAAAAAAAAGDAAPGKATGDGGSISVAAAAEQQQQAGEAAVPAAAAAAPGSPQLPGL
uniref:B30.2/SPRY domain-containing protein n=1 Tax=Tetradesmus obliquus TaxID=3088 RepID=A0A383WIE8_TETOB|eukprot:jgi/Sobl393_1/2492/SZX76874.1